MEPFVWGPLSLCPRGFHAPIWISIPSGSCPFPLPSARARVGGVLRTRGGRRGPRRDSRPRPGPPDTRNLRPASPARTEPGVLLLAQIHLHRAIADREKKCRPSPAPAARAPPPPAPPGPPRPPCPSGEEPPAPLRPRPRAPRARAAARWGPMTSGATSPAPGPGPGPAPARRPGPPPRASAPGLPRPWAAGVSVPRAAPSSRAVVERLPAGRGRGRAGLQEEEDLLLLLLQVLLQHLLLLLLLPRPPLPPAGRREPERRFTAPPASGVPGPSCPPPVQRLAQRSGARGPDRGLGRVQLRERARALDDAPPPGAGAKRAGPRGRDLPRRRRSPRTRD